MPRICAATVWLPFGPDFLLVASIGLVVALYHLDRSEPQDVLIAHARLGATEPATKQTTFAK